MQASILLLLYVDIGLYTTIAFSSILFTRPKAQTELYYGMHYCCYNENFKNAFSLASWLKRKGIMLCSFCVLYTTFLHYNYSNTFSTYLCIVHTHFALSGSIFCPLYVTLSRNILTRSAPLSKAVVSNNMHTTRKHLPLRNLRNNTPVSFSTEHNHVVLQTYIPCLVSVAVTV